MWIKERKVNLYDQEIQILRIATIFQKIMFNSEIGTYRQKQGRGYRDFKYDYTGHLFLETNGKITGFSCPIEIEVDDDSLYYKTKNKAKFVIERAGKNYEDIVVFIEGQEFEFECLARNDYDVASCYPCKNCEVVFSQLLDVNDCGELTDDEIKNEIERMLDKFQERHFRFFHKQLIDDMQLEFEIDFHEDYMDYMEREYEYYKLLPEE